jgi:hypothetical protein
MTTLVKPTEKGRKRCPVLIRTYDIQENALAERTGGAGVF